MSVSGSPSDVSRSPSKTDCDIASVTCSVLGYAKRRYRLLPLSSKEEALERNILASLKEVPLISMCQFAMQSLGFRDAYRKGLNGRQAAWAAKKYCGHWVIPESILQDLAWADVN